MKENRSHRQGLALVGLRGTGKSSVGRILADRLGRPFADADVELEAASGRSIPSIFEELGEPCFRDWEERMLGELTATLPLLLLMGTWLFALGAVVGSFLNVCIYRIPWQKSVIWPASHCPKCWSAIAARDNVPIFGWLALGGRCRSCRSPISIRYP